MSEKATRISSCSHTTVKPIRILHVVNTMNAGGTETLLMSVYRMLDRSVIQFDFLELRAPDGPCFYDAEIKELGGRIYRFSVSHRDPVGSRRRLTEFYHVHPEFYIVQFHCGYAVSMQVLNVAKKCGITARILHVHSAYMDISTIRVMLHRINCIRSKRIATDYFACSDKAARWFGFDAMSKNWIYVPNGIDLERFSFTSTKRLSARAELGLADDEFCVGIVGRFTWEKNHQFALDVFRALVRDVPCARMLIVGGDGPLEADTLEWIEARDLGGRVTVLKNRSDVDRLYCAMDCFVLTSLFEGLSIVTVEAQACGLPCVVSDVVPDEAIILESALRLPLKAGAQSWADAISATRGTQRNQGSQKQVKAAGFDIQDTARKLTDFYLSCR